MTTSPGSRLTGTWQAEQRTFAQRDLSQVGYVCLWRADGRTELIALAGGYRESTESWADLLRDCARRGMRAPVPAVGAGALGFWGALPEVFPVAAMGDRKLFRLAGGKANEILPPEGLAKNLRAPGNRVI